MDIRQDVALRDFTTMRIGGKASHFVAINSPEEIPEAVGYAKDNELEIFVLGGGSNTIFGNQDFNGLVMHIKIPGFSITESDDKSLVTIGAGEVWDDVVKQTVEAGLSGIETLSAIPGSAGATPVQNVGAYGQEIADTFVKLTAYDIETNMAVTLSKADCEFSYRSSIFKTTARNRYIITSLTLGLTKIPLQPPFYRSLQKYLEENSITDYSPASIRQAVIAVRASKLPNPSLVANSGSFFQNPIISGAKLNELMVDHPQIPNFPVTGGNFKVPAGWLIEHAGLKNYRHGHFSTYELNALVITNDGQGDFEELQQFINHIKKTVADKFGIELSIEPIII